jgi:hypothetical protein
MNEVANRMAMLAAAEKVETGVVVKRAVGFAPTFEFVAEATVEAQDGYATVREGAYTEDGALARVRAAALAKVTARRRALGFTAEGFRTRGTRAEFGIGFA